MRLLSKIDPHKVFVLFAGILVFFYLYPDLFLHPNSYFIASEGDSMKNYYTYVYQVKHGDSFFNFNGLNYPYGEHITFTDGQPLLTMILYFLPFLGDYAVGIMNLLVIFSFAFLPYVAYLILRKFDLDKLTCVAGSFAVAILSPQILRLSGHFSLTYAVMFPLLILLILNFFESRRLKTCIHLFLLTMAGFLLHPYTGFAFTVFTTLSLTLYYFIARKETTLKIWNYVFKVFVGGIAGIITFKLLLLLTDHHGFRYNTPYGYDEYKATVESVFVPYAGPFRHFLSQIFKVYKQEMEGIGYIGIATVFVLTITILLKIVFFKRFTFPKYTFVLFIPAVLLLLLSFGVHLKFGDSFTKLMGPIKQFRALGRFCWMFYYVSTLFCFIFTAQIFKTFFPAKKIILTIITSFVFLGFFIVESKTYHIDHNYFVAKDANKFLESSLSTDQKQLTAEIRKHKYQCIITFPYFHVGSEYFNREVNNFSYVDAMIISYHCGVPLMGNIGSRTALEETKNELRVLNPFTDKTALRNACHSDLPIAVLVTKEPDLFDEQEFIKKCTYVNTFGNIKLYTITWNKIMENELVKKYAHMQFSKEKRYFSTDSSKFILKNTWNNTGADLPYIEGTPGGYTVMGEILPGKLPAGEYVFTCHYNYDEEAQRINNNLIFEIIKDGKSTWPIVINTRSQSGIFKNEIVFEAVLPIADTAATYRFLYNGYPSNKVFRASYMMFRKRESTILQTDENGKVVSINNYSLH